MCGDSGRAMEGELDSCLVMNLIRLLCLLVFVVLLVVFAFFLCGGFGHELFEGHEVSFFFGVSLGLTSVST